jgi:hypothetical protein
MLTIIIKKSPAVKLFDPMPLPRAKIRRMTFSRKELAGLAAAPFQRKVSRIR